MNILEGTLYESEWKKIPIIRERTDAAICVLVLLRSLFFQRNIPFRDRKAHCWYYQELSRIFWSYADNSIHSMRVPFYIKNVAELEIIIPVIRTRLQYEYIDELICLFQGIKDNVECMKSIEGIDNEFSDMLQQHQIVDIKQIEDLWFLFIILSTFEPGYLRYDYDPEREKEDIHPLHHLDICFNKHGTYKMGLKGPITLDKFVDLLDISTDCYYIGKS